MRPQKLSDELASARESAFRYRAHEGSTWPRGVKARRRCRGLPLAGDLELAQAAVDDVLRGIDKLGGQGWQAYALTVRAALRRTRANARGCEQDLLQAMDVARAQRALGYEFRAANCLASL